MTLVLLILLKKPLYFWLNKTDKNKLLSGTTFTVAKANGAMMAISNIKIKHE